MNTQAAKALRAANERRAILAALREHIATLGLRDGCAFVANLLDDPGEHEAAIPVGRLLMSVDRFGMQSLTLALRDAGILSADKRVRDLTPRQRTALADVLRDRASRYLAKTARVTVRA